jgi:plasmid stabilization system protein ParE
MAARLIVSPDARDNIADAEAWYEAQRLGAGQKFMARMRRCIRAIRNAPLGHTPLHGPYRRAVVPGYPYIAIYRYDPTTRTVSVVALWHTSRDPNDLLDRLP